MLDIMPAIYDKMAIANAEAHDKAVKAFINSLKREEEWKQMVADGLATCTRTPVIGGYRLHYELINKSYK